MKATGWGESHRRLCQSRAESNIGMLDVNLERHAYAHLAADQQPRLAHSRRQVSARAESPDNLERCA